MNIFALDDDPKLCAQAHVDKHVIKMILEYAQLLSNAHHHFKSVVAHELYKKTHFNHPSAVWVRQSRSNYIWLSKLLRELIAEYAHRYGRVHATQRIVPLLSCPPKGLKDNGLTPPPPAMADEYKVFPNPKTFNESVVNYRSYYAKGKWELHAWKNRGRPDWI